MSHHFLYVGNAIHPLYVIGLWKININKYSGAYSVPTKTQCSDRTVTRLYYRCLLYGRHPNRCQLPTVTTKSNYSNRSFTSYYFWGHLVSTGWFLKSQCRTSDTFLLNSFPGRLTSTRDMIKRPLRPPELSTSDFFLWLYLKESAYRHRFQVATNLDELRGIIINFMPA